MKITPESALFIAAAIVVPSFGLAITVASYRDSHTFQAIVVDTENASERRAVVVMGKSPRLFKYGNHSNGTWELCLIGTNPDLPKTCFRTGKGFDVTNPSVQAVRLVKSGW